jgi:predicted transcriptional regulator
MNLKTIKKSLRILSSIFIVSIFIFQAIPNITYAATVEELQAKIDEKNRNIDALNKEIQMYADLTDKTSKEAQTLQAKIKT